MTPEEIRSAEASYRKIHRELMARPRKCPVCQVTWASEPSGYCTYRQIPVWNPPEDAPPGVCFKCCPPDWGGVHQGRLTISERLDQQDESWDRWMRELEAAEWRSGLYSDPVSPRERRER